MIAVLFRALLYGSLFASLVFVYLPGRTLAWAGVSIPHGWGLPQIGGFVVGAVGAALALWSIATFIVIGRGTPAPFDPPRRLVVRGPYAHVRNPMYWGAALALTGAAIYCESIALLAYVGAFLIVTELFVRWYEEPTLRQMFGAEYDVYCREVPRWRPIREAFGTQPSRP
jgi:protein-S-isoprenylcysteine O-methyltransferase Ste14